MIALCGLACAAAMSMPSGASAKDFNLSFDVRGGHGVGVSFTADDDGEVEITAVRGGKPPTYELQAATYRLPKARTVTRHHVVADFGRLGRIDVRYRDKPGLQRCTEDTGTVRGVIRFRGEHGYARVMKKRAGATLSPYRCGGTSVLRPRRALGGGVAPAPESRRGLGRAATLLACRPDDGLLYSAVDSEGTVLHDAQLYERSKRLRIVRTTQYTGRPRSFTYAAGPATATVTPAGGFSGSATFEDGGLSGDLAASFLGISDPVQLAPAIGGLDVGDKGDFPAACLKVQD